MNRMTRYLFIPALLTMSVAAQTETDCATPAGATVPDGQVNATATFVTNPGTIMITLTDMLENPKSAGQLLSGLAFSVSEGETTGTLGNNSAQNTINVQQDGTVQNLGPGSTGWALAQNFNGGLELCVLCTSLGALGPSHLLIGPPDPMLGYSFANRSIALNAPHNPFDKGTASFLVNVPGVTSNSTITSATFFFSTTAGVSVGGSCSSSGGGPGPILF